jgi:TRAP-type mannitol/chloroaromatic compound transport system permease large subunit
MSPTTQGAIVFVVTLLMLVSGIPVAFGLGAIAIGFLVLFQGFDALHVVAETFWSARRIHARRHPDVRDDGCGNRLLSGRQGSL